ncbi:AraC family transcriptional regulator [Mesorhizobium sp. M0904]|uniref:AraC family transcriptional regulator n=1 Tax=Mesorhizobium sp. M0904 TaxID=2957022 RepID=UPI0033399F3E
MSDKHSDKQGGLTPTAQRQVLNFIHANLDTPITISELSAIAGLSRFHFARMFKQSMGQTTHQFVTKRRIERCKQLIAEGQALAQVALACGYSSQSHFSAQFRRFTGLTPSVFREACCARCDGSCACQSRGIGKVVGHLRNHLGTEQMAKPYICGRSTRTGVEADEANLQ